MAGKIKHCTETYCKFCKHEKYIDYGPGGAWYVCKRNPQIYKNSRTIGKTYLDCEKKNINRDCKDFEPTFCTKLFNKKMIPKWHEIIQKNK